MSNPNRNMAIVRAIREHGQPVSDVAKRFKVSRQWVYTLLQRYDAGGELAVLPQSKTPKTNPRRVPETVRKEIIKIRKNLTKHGFDAGPDTIAYHLEQQGLYVPSVSTIRRIITQAGLVTPQPQKRPRNSYIRFEAAQPNECWQSDITHLWLSGGRRVEVLDFIDDHSRYLLHIEAFMTCSGRQVAATMNDLITAYGPPASTLTDNGLVFTARLAGAKGGRNAFEVLLAKHMIQQKNGRPGHPQTQGKIERFHQTLKKWIKKQPQVDTITELQQQLDQFRDYYNTTRPHRAIGRKTPHQAYTATPKAIPSATPQSEWRTRNDRVDKAGRVTIRYAGKMFHLGIGRGYAGQEVTMVITDKYITTALKETGEIIAEHIIDVSRDYQKPIKRLES